MAFLAGPVISVDEEDVLPAVVIVIEEGDPGAHGFRQPLFTGGGVVVSEVEPGGVSDVFEMDRICRATLLRLSSEDRCESERECKHDEKRTSPSCFRVNKSAGTGRPVESSRH